MDNMPPLPEPDAWLCSLYNEDGTVKTMVVDQDPEGLRFNDMGEPSPFLAKPLIDTRKAHAYARAYAEQRCAPLVEALRNLIEAADSMRGTYGVIWGDTPEDCDTFTHDQWAEDFLKERAEEASAALAAQEKHHG